MITKKAAISFIPLICVPLLSCATNYALDIDQANKSVVQDNPTQVIGATDEFTKARVSAQDLYHSVYVAASAPPSGTGIDVCRTTFFDKFLLAKQNTISLNVISNAGSPTATPIPIYTASTAPGSCNIAFDHRYVLPPQTIASVSHLNIPVVYASQTSVNEKISTYLKDALSFAGSFASGGAPIVASITNVTNSAVAGDVRNDFNQAFSSKNQLTDSLVDLTFEATPPAQISTTYKILARPLKNGAISKDPPLILGSLVVTLERDLTVIGSNHPGHLPDYSSVSETTKIGTVIEDANGTKSFEYNYLDFIANAPPAQAVDNVQKLAGNATSDSVKQVCKALRVTLDKLGLNRLDSTVFLWRVYTWSDYAQANQPADSQGPCLQSKGDLDLITALRLTEWLKAPRAEIRRHGVPSYYVPGISRR